MKEKDLRELTPFIASAMLLAGCFLSNGVAAVENSDEMKVTISDDKMRENDDMNIDGVMTLLMSSIDEYGNNEYTYLKNDDIDKIVYGENNSDVTIYLVDSTIYVGHYDDMIQNYIFEVKSKQYVKK